MPANGFHDFRRHPLLTCSRGECAFDTTGSICLLGICSEQQVDDLQQVVIALRKEGYVFHII